MNRETKRMLQRQGQIGPDGTPLATPRQPSRSGPAPRPANAPRRSPLGYLREVRNELRKVSWPTKLEVRNYSIVVLITLLILLAIILVLDYAFSEAAIFLFK